MLIMHRLPRRALLTRLSIPVFPSPSELPMRTRYCFSFRFRKGRRRRAPGRLTIWPLQIGRNLIWDWYVHRDWFSKGPRVVRFLLSRFGLCAPSLTYSGIAAAKVSEIRRSFVGLPKNSDHGGA